MAVVGIIIPGDVRKRHILTETVPWTNVQARSFMGQSLLLISFLMGMWRSKRNLCGEIQYLTFGEFLFNTFPTVFETDSSETSKKH